MVTQTVRKSDYKKSFDVMMFYTQTMALRALPVAIVILVLFWLAAPTLGEYATIVIRGFVIACVLGIMYFYGFRFKKLAKKIDPRTNSIYTYRIEHGILTIVHIVKGIRTEIFNKPLSDCVKFSKWDSYIGTGYAKLTDASVFIGGNSGGLGTNMTAYCLIFRKGGISALHEEYEENWTYNDTALKFTPNIEILRAINKSIDPKIKQHSLIDLSDIG
ncbi:MAG: hypothetical protein LBN42_04150 [Oscillospiraceae bacterium]|jgi:hypothetical protein|nr:hypothetical protein [Oscillospiraceae bacterium]